MMTMPPPTSPTPPPPPSQMGEGDKEQMISQLKMAVKKMKELADANGIPWDLIVSDMTSEKGTPTPPMMRRPSLDMS